MERAGDLYEPEMLGGGGVRADGEVVLGQEQDSSHNRRCPRPRSDIVPPDEPLERMKTDYGGRVKYYKTDARDSTR